MNRIYLAFFATLLLVSGCEEPPNATQIEAQKQEQLTMQGVQSVGLPGITQFAEKRLFKDILELRDKSVPTFTYLVGMNNELKLVCNSVGFPIPGGTQYTNPQMMQWMGSGRGWVQLPQADPNGLYSPANAEGTYVYCIDPTDKKAKPVYVEPRVITSPFPLK